MTEYNFCPACSKKLEKKKIDGKIRQKCPRCGFVYYKNPLPAAAAIVIKRKKILLVKRKFEPGKGCWALPSGFIERGERPDEACSREVLEETGLLVKPTKLLGLYRQLSVVYGDVLVAVFLASVIQGEISPGDDAQDAAFFTFDDMPKIPFRCNREAIDKFVGKNRK